MSDVKAKTLTEKQQRQSLSGPKKNSNKSIRNVLSKPYSNFWPLANSLIESEISLLLESLLPSARKLITSEDRRVLRKLQGKKMKDQREILTEKIWERNPGSKELRNLLALGVNDVSRGLEENSLSSILISNEADPPLLTRHLAVLAASRHVPHLVLQNLKTTTKKCLDFSTLAMGFKKTVAEEDSNHFHSIHKKIDEGFRTITKDLVVHLHDQEKKVESTTETDLKLGQANSSYRKPSEIYLTRSSKQYRAFIPGKGLQQEIKPSWSQYISFSNEDEAYSSSEVSKAPLEILGSKPPSDTRSFLQKVKDAKNVLQQRPSQVMETGNFLSISSDTLEDHGVSVKEEHLIQEEQPSKKKAVKRYFSNLEPLKVKRIQGNPEKVKKKQNNKSV